MLGTPNTELLSPNTDVIRPATIAALKALRGVDDAAATQFPEKLAATVPAPLSAKASIIFALFFGKLTVDGLPEPYQKWKYDVDVWGGGATGGTAIGLMYTAYDSWDAFFRNVTSFHVQAIAEGGGILQVNWFIANATPVGQFNGALGGLGALEAGGPGVWKS